MVTKEEGIAALLSANPMGYDDLEVIFAAFGIDGHYELPNRVWYFHDEYTWCGRFPAPLNDDIGVLSDTQRTIALNIVRCVWQQQELRGQR